MRKFLMIALNTVMLLGMASMASAATASLDSASLGYTCLAAALGIGIAAFGCGIGMGLGATIAMTLVGTIREIIGNGTWMGMTVTANLITPMSVLILAPGGFFVYGLMIAVMNKLTKGGVKRKSFDCEGCPTASACQNKEGGCN